MRNERIKVDGPGCCPLYVEVLEERCLLSCAMEQDGTDLTITGTRRANDISVVIHDDQTLSVECDGAQADDFGGVESITISSGNGADIVDVVLEDRLTETLMLEIDLGAGADDSNLDFGGTIDSVSLDIVLTGGAGADLVTLALGAIGTTQVSIDFDLGAGNDDAYVFFNGDIADSVVTVSIDGGTGADFIDVVSQDNDGDPTGLNVEGSSLSVLLQGSAGNDDLYVDLTPTDDGAGSVTVEVDGGSGRDKERVLVDDSAFTGTLEASIEDSVGKKNKCTGSELVTITCT